MRVVGEVDIGVQAVLCKIEFERIEWGRNHSRRGAAPAKQSLRWVDDVDTEVGSIDTRL